MCASDNTCVLNPCDTINLSIAKNISCYYVASVSQEPSLSRWPNWSSRPKSYLGIFMSCQFSHWLGASKWVSDQGYQQFTSHFREMRKSLDLIFNQRFLTWPKFPISLATPQTYTFLSMIFYVSGPNHHTSSPTFSPNTHPWRPAKVPLFAKSWLLLVPQRVHSSMNLPATSQSLHATRDTSTPLEMTSPEPHMPSYQGFLTLLCAFDCVSLSPV